MEKQPVLGDTRGVIVHADDIGDAVDRWKARGWKVMRRQRTGRGMVRLTLIYASPVKSPR